MRKNAIGKPKLGRNKVQDPLVCASDRANRVVEYCERNVLQLPIQRGDYCRVVAQALLSVMRDQLATSILSARQYPGRSFPLIVLHRPIYEAYLKLRYLFMGSSEQERQKRGRLFLHLMESEKIGIRNKALGGQEKVKSAVAPEHTRNHERSIEIARDTKRNFSASERKQWDNIDEIAKEVLTEDFDTIHGNWYGIMSKATHVAPAMIHWSYKPGPQNELQVHHARCEENTMVWLHKSTLLLMLGSRLVMGQYEITESTEDVKLREELLGIPSSEPSASTESSIANHPLIRDLVQRITSVVKPIRILLFGSAVRGEMRPDSDLDVLVVLADGSDRTGAEKRLYQNMWGFPSPVDFIAVTESDAMALTTQSAGVIHQAISDGEEIYRVAL